MSDLASKTCVPCTGSVPPLKGQQIQALLSQLTGWRAVDDHHLEKTYEFDDFVTSLAFVNKLGDLAEEQSHHPDIHLSWGQVRVEIWTHAIDGLTESDFILAAKSDRLYR
jgi:4a-hydroxytetrahydrobiopterin dehydratase